MIPFHLARVTNASMLSLALYLIHHVKSTEQGFFTATELTRLQ